MKSYYNDLLKYVDKRKKNEIMKYWSILTRYEEFNKLFHKELLKALENSYFDYSLIALSIAEQKDNRKQYIEAQNGCSNKVVRYLFYGTQIHAVSEITTKGFLYTRRAFYGMGVYFSDMLDYIGFYSGGTNYNDRRDNFGIILPVGTSFSCVGAEIYYSRGSKKDIFDKRLYVPDLPKAPTYEELQSKFSDKKVPKYGIHFVKVEAIGGNVRKKEEIKEDNKKGKFLGNEYVITEFCQILPLYGLTFKRNEYFVLWRDPNFKGKNVYSDYLKERKLFINKEAQMNAYFESSTEKALEIIKRKNHNKIILITSCSDDLSGKKFVEIARKILGYDVLVLFFSSNQKNFDWINTFPNCLYTNEDGFYRDYIKNYNKNGLVELRKKINEHYKDEGLKLKEFDEKFLDYYFDAPKNNEKNIEKHFADLSFNEPTPYFKKVTIKNSKNDLILCMDQERRVLLHPRHQLNIESYFIMLLF